VETHWGQQIPRMSFVFSTQLPMPNKS